MILQSLDQYKAAKITLTAIFRGWASQQPVEVVQSLSPMVAIDLLHLGCCFVQSLASVDLAQSYQKISELAVLLD